MLSPTTLLPLVLLGILGFSSCSPDQNAAGPDFSAVEVRYEVIANGWQGQRQYKAAFTLINHGAAMLPDTGWSLWFNQGYRRLVADSTTGGVRIERLSGDWYRLSPKKGFRLPPDSSVVVTMVGSWSIAKVSDAPCGLYFAFGESRIPVRQYHIAPFTRPEQIHRIPGDRVPIPTAALDFERNSRLSLLEADALTPVLPTPVLLRRGGGTIALRAHALEIHYQPPLAREAALLADRLEGLTGRRPKLVAGGNGGAGKILLATSPLQVAGKSREAYRLSANEVSGIEILGSDAAGVFYGCQTLLQLLPIEAWAAPVETLRVPAVMIEDAPRFGWRGMHLDAARNFHKKESVLRLLDLMAFYKLNRLHFHLANDEGWRIEIPGLPELTEVGGRRGHTLDEQDHLHPSYGSGPDVDAPDNHGTGHYSRADFVEILRYAADRHIEVVPEIVVPGHARAAIKAMEARFRKYMAAGDEAEARRYLLSEAADTSRYLSVQGYDDNVINVCLESTWAFLDKVTAELQRMYADAGLELHMLHTGGDEVPRGTWTGSPACGSLLAARDELQQPCDLTCYFRRRLRDLLRARGLQMAGWEEVGMRITDEGVAPDPEFVPDSIVLFIWNSLWGQQDLGYRLANAGYPVVLCNVTNLYFDLAYDKDPNEPGLYWGGYVNTRMAWEFQPLDLFRSMDTDPLGNPFTPEDFAGMERLRPEAAGNILGLQGQLWSETIKGQDMLEYYYLPKMPGLAERAWAPQPDWATLTDPVRWRAARANAWNEFANRLGQRELPRLDYLNGGYAYRLPPPGVRVSEGVLHANVAFPGLTIRYTTDGSLPDMQSAVYRKPVQVGHAEVRVAVFDRRGRMRLMRGDRGAGR